MCYGYAFEAAYIVLGAALIATVLGHTDLSLMSTFERYAVPNWGMSFARSAARALPVRRMP
jgi:hypothetical protein